MYDFYCQVCLTKLKDIQLAIVIARLYSDDMTESGLPDSVRNILLSEVQCYI